MTWDEVQELKRARSEALNAGGYTWGPLDRAPLGRLARESAAAVGLTPDRYRAARALIERAPDHIREPWAREELGTPAAYAALIAWEAGRLL